ncbi:MAG: hypothetical protein ACYDD0_00835 [Candidatus Dormibacteria bacterium]
MAELEAIRARHQRVTLGPNAVLDRQVEMCPADGRPWPCDTAQVLAEVERLRGVVAVMQSEHYRVFSPMEPEGGGCICEADDCPELEALAALEEGE